MTEALDKSPATQKKLPLTAGTAVFVFACFLLVAGLCKFSFYVLKNHRSAVSRDDFIQAYVDVPPAENIAKKNAYIIFNESDVGAPSVFFDSKRTEKPIAAAQTKPLAPPSPLPVYKRPAPVLPAPAPEIEDDSGIPDADSTPIPVDDLLLTGRNILASLDKAVLESEDLLADESTAEAVLPEKSEPVIAAAEESKPAPAIVAQAKASPAPTVSKPRKSESGERWLDIAALRREVEREAANAAFLNQPKQTAALEIAETDAAPQKTAPAPAKDDRPAQPSSSPFLTKEQAAQQPSVPKQSPFLSKEQIAKQSSAPQSPWKIAKANGKPANALAVKHAAPVETPSKADSATAEKAIPAQTAKVIYKNGRAKEIATAESDKSLNWLDRKQAAVWTSLSQSDTPSVWTVSDSRPAQTAKAFRIAAEETAAPADKPAEPTEISSAEVRAVGKEEKPEAIANPVLLPLGAPDGSIPTAAPIAAASAPAAAASASVPAIAPIVPAVSAAKEDAVPAADAQKKADPSLVNKLFSIFNASDDEALPTIGASAETPSEKKEATAGKPQKAPAVAIREAASSLTSAKEAATKEANKKIMPTEIRLTFKPGSTEISAQSVKWIKAFGASVKQDIQRAIEVRMSTENLPLQEKRFALIRSTLVGAGVEDDQIVPFITNRSPHTIVLRSFEVPEEGVTEYTTSVDGMKEELYYRKW